ncbi:endolytic transglycosylase MltG, partial [bacterium]|nr:endolytic transglycosylase MltG [candidate division CSSED10-310 bacterium]
LTSREMAIVWERSGHGTAARFLDAVRTYGDRDIPVPATGWEGYLFPETYIFPAQFTEAELIARMVEQFKTIVRQEWRAAARERRLDLHGLVTLASLIEKETRLSDERPLVSAVFHNRLKKGMLLQCDPTVVFAMGDAYPGRLLKKHLEIDHPYNTYVHPGLPPGPIASPGADSLAAACFPADSDFLYFVADHTGGHRFSQTLAEHNQAVNAYRRGRKPSTPM